MNSSGYAIKQYGIIGNCETAALINPDGGIDWLCLPAFDAASFFGALLDRERGGEFLIRPSEPYQVERRYLEESAILQTRFVTERATILLTDFFVIARKQRARFYDFTSLHPARKLVRIVEVEKGGQSVIELRLAARPDYARERPNWKRTGNSLACEEARFVSNIQVEQRDSDICASFVLERGDRYFAVLDYSHRSEEIDGGTVERWLEVSKAFWREWNLFNYYQGPHKKVVRRSAVTLKLLTYAPSGAIVAAPTTSLPEKIGGDANWDYRFTWVRDTALVINALFRLGYSGEAKAFLNFLAEKHCDQCEDGDSDLPVLLPCREESRVKEETLDHLSGYRDSRPVRRGNRAGADLQLDLYGYILQSLYFWKHTGGKIDKAKYRVAIDALRMLRRRWREPDNGIWEGQERKQYTNSKVSAWLAIARGRDLGLIDRQEADELCREIEAAILKHGVRERDGQLYLAQTFESDAIDCSALLAFTTGFLEEGLARSTRAEVEKRLASGPWVYRSDSHRESGEGGFVLCSFWRIAQLIAEGDLIGAERSLEQILAAASPLGLYSEEIDPGTGEFLGNFPQAFSHLGLIIAILDLEEAKKKPGFARASDHEKFQRSVGPTIGWRGVIAGLFRVPATAQLFFSKKSKWRGC